MAGKHTMSWTPRNKRFINARNEAIQRAVVAKTTHLSEEQKEMINRVSGSEEANRFPVNWDATKHVERTHHKRVAPAGGGGRVVLQPL